MVNMGVLGYLSPTSLLQALVLFTGLAVTPVRGQNSTGDFATQCTNFADTLRNTVNATVWFTVPVAAGTNVSIPDNGCGAQEQPVAVDLCRVSMFYPTSDRSNITRTFFFSFSFFPAYI